MQVDSEHVVLANPWHEVGPILEQKMCVGSIGLGLSCYMISGEDDDLT